MMGFLTRFFGRNTDKKVNNKFSSIEGETDLPGKQKRYGEVSEANFLELENLSTNRAYHKFEIGKLKVLSGKIVCADPLHRELGFPQIWEVEKGEYPVNIYISLDGEFQGRVAYAELIFSSNRIKSWKLSLIDEYYLKDDFEKELNGMYPVENGLSSFSDFETWKHYDKYVSEYQKQSKELNFYMDILEPLFKANDGIPKSSRGEDWLNYHIEHYEGNIIMFGSGWGDGLYSRYIGVDENDQPVKFITDFIQLDEEE